MTEPGQKHFEIPMEMRSMADAGLEQARKTLERFIEGAQAAAETLSTRTTTVGVGAKDASAMAFSYAEKNVQASLDYAQSLVHAKDLSEVIRLHREYIQAQMRSLAEQASDIGQIMSRTAMDAAKPKH
jgi:phasin